DRGMDVVLTRTGKKMKLSQSTQFMADERETVNEAFAGDVIGLYDSGNYQIGDTITNGDPSLQYEALPTFAPELFLKVYTKNALKSKQFQKGVEQLAQEGAIQVYKTEYNEIILGAIGQLQFEVFEHRLKGEYGVDILKDAANFQVAKWIKPAEVAAVKQLTDSRTVLVYDRWENAVLLFANDFVYERFVQKNEGTITLVDSPQQL
ncbi:MAG: EF-Tu/IF-2/RF-3 family GTPase, partial [Exiguobacterium acetylicum]